MRAYKTAEGAAKVVARKRGVVGRLGGWLYQTNEQGVPVRSICQGWGNYAARLQRTGHITGNWKTGYFIAGGKA